MGVYNQFLLKMDTVYSKLNRLEQRYQTRVSDATGKEIKKWQACARILSILRTNAQGFGTSSTGLQLVNVSLSVDEVAAHLEAEDLKVRPTAVRNYISIIARGSGLGYKLKDYETKLRLTR